MLRLRKTTNINNEKGVVFILVISVIIVTMILAISILSINTSQVVSTEAEVRRVQAETLALGAMDYSVARAANGTLSSGTLFSQNLDGTTYNVNASFIANGLNIYVNY
jgi:type II secretory pathway component PulK